VDVVRRHQAEGARPEPRREVRPVLEGLELGLGEGVVGRGLRTVGAGDHAEGATSRATDWDVMEGPQSAWMMSWSGPIELVRATLGEEVPHGRSRTDRSVQL